jgi:phosphate-selective porin OprO/OprP
MLNPVHIQRFKKSALAITLAAIAAPAFSASNEELDQPIRILERQLENQQEAADTKAKESAKVTADTKGFTIQSANGDYALSLGGVLQTDARFFTGDTSGAAFADQFLIRRVEPSIKGKLGKYVSFVITPQFGGSTTGTRLLDFYTDLKFDPAASVRVGRFKEGIGLENLQSTPNLTFIERGLTNNLSPTREIGASLNGLVLSDTLFYSVGIFNGTSEGSDGAEVTEADNRHEYAARIFAEPFKNDPGFLQGLGFGVAGTVGATRGTASNAAVNVLISSGSGNYVSPGQNKIFGYRAATNADGYRGHLAPQAYWYYNNYGLLSEYIISEAEVVNGANRDYLRHTAYQFIFNYVITGEDAGYKGVKPSTPFQIGNDGWGAFEVALRTGGLNIDSDSFAGGATSFADPTTQVSRAREYGFATNWYLNANTKIGLNYEYTTFSGGNVAASDGNRDPEHAILARLQIAY